MHIIIKGGSSALMMAAEMGMAEGVSLLLKAGATIDLQNEVYTQCSTLLRTKSLDFDSNSSILKATGP